MTRTRSHRTGRLSEAGFAAIAVLWGLGLIAVIAAAIMTGARARSRDASTERAIAAAQAAAESGIALGLLRADVPDGPHASRCVLPGGELLTLTIADEAGKIDLNAAPLALLAKLFAALTDDAAQGDRVAKRIVEFRTPLRGMADRRSDEAYAAQNKREGAMRGGFGSILELDQVADVPPALFRKALPFVTVKSQQAEVDMARATPALRRLFGLPVAPPDAGPSLPPPPPQAAGQPAQPTPPQPGARAFTITADIRIGRDVRLVRDALVMSETEPTKAAQAARLEIREWRRGDAPADEKVADRAPPPPKPCLPALVAAK